MNGTVVAMTVKTTDRGHPRDCVQVERPYRTDELFGRDVGFEDTNGSILFGSCLRTGTCRVGGVLQQRTSGLLRLPPSW